MIFNWSYLFFDSNFVYYGCNAYRLNGRRVRCEPSGQRTRIVLLPVKPVDFLSQHAFKGQSPYSSGQILSRNCEHPICNQYVCWLYTRITSYETVHLCFVVSGKILLPNNKLRPFRWIVNSPTWWIVNSPTLQQPANEHSDANRDKWAWHHQGIMPLLNHVKLRKDLQNRAYSRRVPMFHLLHDNKLCISEQSTSVRKTRPRAILQWQSLKSHWYARMVYTQLELSKIGFLKKHQSSIKVPNDNSINCSFRNA